MTIGNQIEMELHDSAPSCLVSLKPIRNLQDLLNVVDRTLPMQSNLRHMLHSTARHISACLRKSYDNILVDELVPLKPKLKIHLREGHFKPNTIKSYCTNARTLVEIAKQHGWVSCLPDLTKDWQTIRQGISKTAGCLQIVNYAIAAGKKPDQFSEGDLKEWCKLQIARGRHFMNVRDQKARFRRFIFRTGLNGLMPNLSPPGLKPYGIPLKQIPEPLQAQITRLREWKEAEFSPGRNRHCRHRPETAQAFQDFICRYYSFTAKHVDPNVSDLKALCNEDTMFAFVNWCRTERANSKRSLSMRLEMLYAALRTYPLFQGQDFGWLKRIIEQLCEDEDDLTRAKEGKQKRWVDYDQLSELPSRMLADADRRYTRGSKQYASAMRDILLITWLLILPWRQRNLRECRIGSREDGANIFKEKIGDLPTIARSDRIQEALKQNPAMEVWQFKFRPRETKTGHLVHGLLPRQITVLLPEYVSTYRPLLIVGCDPGTLFLNDKGRPFSAFTIRYHVEKVAVQYFGRRVNPHLFRDIYAVKFLEEHPENYLTLSKILWHHNVQTTINLYGRNYDESHGARVAEEWLDERAKKNRR